MTEQKERERDGNGDKSRIIGSRTQINGTKKAGMRALQEGRGKKANEDAQRAKR